MALCRLLCPAASAKQSTREAPWQVAGRATLSSGYGAPNMTRSPPMWPRRQVVSICSHSAVETVHKRAVAVMRFGPRLPTMKAVFRWSSGSWDGSSGGGDDRWSSSKQQLGMGGIVSAGWQCELMRQWQLGLGTSNQALGQGLYRGELGLRHMNSRT
jgi:hypothetical protein